MGAKQRVCLAALTAVAVGGALWHFASDTPTAGVQPSTRWAAMPAAGDGMVHAGFAPASAIARLPPLRFKTMAEYETVSRYGRLPNSLTGTSVNWNITTTNGKLVPTRDLAALFEFFLSAHTEEGLPTVLGRIDEYLRGLLPDAAAAEAMDILQAYMAYKQGLTRFEPPKDRVFTGNQAEDLVATVADVKAAMAQRAAARRQFLGAEVADAFFQGDEAYDAYTIKRLEADSNTSLSAADREALIAQAEQLLPEDKRAQVQQDRKEAALNQRIEALRARGGSEDTVRQLRAELYGAQEAERLAVVDQQQRDWTQRLQSYREAKDGVLGQTALGPDAKAASIDAMEQARFSPTELREVRILESIRAQNAQSGKTGQSG